MMSKGEIMYMMPPGMISFDHIGTRLSSISRIIRRPMPERASIIIRDGLSIAICPPSVHSLL